jgi:hypothetical protein
MEPILLFVLTTLFPGGIVTGNGPSITAQLVAESKAGLSLVESKILPTAQFDRDDAQAAEEYIHNHKDYTAYHLLFALRKAAPDLYGSIPDSTRASILCSTLQNSRYLNDWGYLEPNESFDGEAAIALLATGRKALDCLKAILDDEREAPLFGTEEATMSSTYRYRRKDFAYRYILLALGRPSRFRPVPSERDQDIRELQKNLKEKDQKS